MTIKFDTKGLTPKQFAERISRLNMLDVSEVVAETSLDLIADGFTNEQDPDGAAWEPLAIRKGSILQDTGGLRNSWARGDVTPSESEVVTGKEYADYHQQGTGVYGSKKQPITPLPGRKSVNPLARPALTVPGVGYRASVAGTPQRKMVPDGALPGTWEIAYDEAVTEYIQGVLDEQT